MTEKLIRVNRCVNLRLNQNFETALNDCPVRDCVSNPLLLSNFDADIDWLTCNVCKKAGRCNGGVVIYTRQQLQSVICNGVFNRRVTLKVVNLRHEFYAQRKVNTLKNAVKSTLEVYILENKSYLIVFIKRKNRVHPDFSDKNDISPSLLAQVSEALRYSHRAKLCGLD
jgi:hypothetical protein